MREFGISYDEGSGLPVGHYVLHRRDGLSLPTVFGSFDAGRCGPIDGTCATRLCMAMGPDLSRVERFCMHSAEATLVWSADGKPPQPKTIDEEIASLGADDQAVMHAVLDGATGHCREELEGGAAWYREKGLPAIAVAFTAESARRPTADEQRAAAAALLPKVPAPPGDLANPVFEPIHGADVADDPSLSRLDPNAPDGPMVSAALEVPAPQVEPKAKRGKKG